MAIYLIKGQVAKYDVIELGAEVCKIIKKTYFKDIHWSECHNQIADKFTILKKIMRRLNPEKCDKDLLLMLRNYSTDDMLDVFSHE